MGAISFMIRPAWNLPVKSLVTITIRLTFSSFADPSAKIAASQLVPELVAEVPQILLLHVVHTFDQDLDAVDLSRFRYHIPGLGRLEFVLKLVELFFQVPGLGNEFFNAGNHVEHRLS